MEHGHHHHNHKGYSDIFDMQVHSIPRIPRPHRKALLNLPKREKKSYILGPSGSTLSSPPITPPRLQPTTTPSQAARKTNIKPQHPYMHENSIAAAIDVAYIPNTRTRLVHPPPRLPPFYDAYLKDVARLSKILDDGDDDGGGNGGGGISGLSVASLVPVLKFEGGVAEGLRRVGAFRVGGFAGKSMVGGGSGDAAVADAHEVRVAEARKEQRRVHSSMKMSAPENGEGYEPALENEDFEPGAVSRPNENEQRGERGWKGAVKMTGFERNVPYMLDVWQRVEGVDLIGIMGVPVGGTGEAENRKLRSARSLERRVVSPFEAVGSPSASLLATSPHRNEGAPSDANLVISKSHTSFEHSSTRPHTNATTVSTSTDTTAPSTTDTVPATPASAKSAKSTTTPFIKDHQTPTTPLPPAAPTVDAKTLSSGTISLLKHLTQETKSNSNTEPAHLPASEVERVLRLTLTGAGQTTHDVLQTTSSVSFSSSNSIGGKTGGGSSTLLKRRKRQTYRLRANGGFVLDTTPESEFLLVLPVSMTDGEDEMGGEEGAYRRRSVGAMSPDGLSGLPQGLMKEKAGVDGAKALSHMLQKATAKPWSAGKLPKSRAKPENTTENALNLTRLVTLIKRYKTTESALTGLESPENIKLESMADFLMTPFTHLEQIPEKNTIAYKILHQTLLFCLLTPPEEDNPHHPLRFESARLLIQLQDFVQLPRWETIAFKTTLLEALNSTTNNSLTNSTSSSAELCGATAQESFLAAITLCTSLGHVDTKTVRKVKQGLGDFQPAIRLQAMQCLSKLPLRHASGVFDMLVSEGVNNTSWRVRMDVVELVSVWIQRVVSDDGAGAIREETLNGDAEGTVVDAMECMSRQVVGEDRESGEDEDTARVEEARAESRNGEKADPDESNSSNQINEDTKGGRKEAVSAKIQSKRVSTVRKASLGITSTDSQTMRPYSLADRLEPQMARAVQMLLDMMWNDWSQDVRTLATKALARLGKGKLVFERIISLLQMKDPARKIDALKCLNALGIVTEDALEAYLDAFKDPYFAVRVEATKVACKIVTAENRALVNTLLDRMSDFDHRVRAYAIKAIGLCQCREPRIRETLYYSLIHDISASVRAEAIHATVQLGLLHPDAQLRETIHVLMETDRDDNVRIEAERVLTRGGYIMDLEKRKTGAVAAAAAASGVEDSNESPSLGGGSEDSSHGAGPRVSVSKTSNSHGGNMTIAAVLGGVYGPVSTATTGGRGVSPNVTMKSNAPSSPPSNQNPSTNHGAKSTITVPTTSGPRVPVNILPAAIQDVSSREDVELYFRDCLVGELEQQAVIDQVKDMSVASVVLREVEQMERDNADLPELGLELEFRKAEKWGRAGELRKSGKLGWRGGKIQTGIQSSAATRFGYF
ncbi:HEAT repeat-containing protein 4 [Chytriomyces hyalinus]|nr:HEAT repeat-containing protein 4 [Chytriomyces hyalinus]